MTIDLADRRQTEAFEMSCYRRVQKITRTDKRGNVEKNCRHAMLWHILTQRKDDLTGMCLGTVIFCIQFWKAVYKGRTLGLVQDWHI